MSHRSILTEKSAINQFLFKLGFFLYFSKPVLKHMEQFIKGSIKKGYKGTVTDIVLLSLANRTIFGEFLSEGVWNINFAWKGIRKFVVRTIYDDTISEKTKPSSKAENTIKETGFHHSHLKHKQVWDINCLQLCFLMVRRFYHILLSVIKKVKKAK